MNFNKILFRESSIWISEGTLYTGCNILTFDTHPEMQILKLTVPRFIY